MGEYQTLLVFAVSSISSGIGLGAMIRTDIKWLRLTSELLEKKRLDHFYDQSTIQPSYSWLFVHVLGKAVTMFRTHKMNKDNYDRYNKSFTYYEKLTIKWIFLVSFGALIGIVLGSHLIDWLG
ncbi:hypothetical protein B6A42_08610 [Vibrio coralliilyticus]|nr:hypothetical protein B6A42_08610 [Vibrio coralliilyticus]